MWNTTQQNTASMFCGNGKIANAFLCGTQQPQREKIRWRDRLFRARRSALAALQILPDGGLVRSTRIARLEAALLIAEGAVPARKLATVARLIDVKEVQQFVQVLNESYAGYILMTRAALSPWLDRLHTRQAEMKLSSPMMETLTIIAYQQPVTRADVEAIRGVQATEMIRQLMDRGLVRIGGEDDSLGRPFLYITTRQFLTLFGLYRLEDLPNYATLCRQRTLLAIAEACDDECDVPEEAA